SAYVVRRRAPMNASLVGCRAVVASRSAGSVRTSIAPLIVARSDPDRKTIPSADRARPHALGILVVDLPPREARQDLLERDPTFEPRERRTQAEVQPVPEAEMVIDRPADVQAVRVREASIVSVRGGGQQEHDRALGHRLPVELDVSRDEAC